MSYTLSGKSMTFADLTLFSLKAIEKAIVNFDLGMNPGNDGDVIRLSIPLLTADRRKVLLIHLFRTIPKYCQSLFWNINRKLDNAIFKRMMLSLESFFSLHIYICVCMHDCAILLWLWKVKMWYVSILLINLGVSENRT